MVRVIVLAAALATVALAGCIGDEARPAANILKADAAPVFTLGTAASSGGAVLFEGARLVGEPTSATNSYPPFVPGQPRPGCDGENCEVVPLQVHERLSLAIMIEWEGQDETWDTTGGPGYYLGDAATRLDAVVKRNGEEVVDVEESFHYGGVGILDAQPGDYEIEVVAKKGTTSYYLVVREQPADVFARQSVDGELLPDLVAIPPDHPTFEMPFGHELGTPAASLVGGCGPDELAEDQDLRCLRFAGIIGNQGPGSFLVILGFDDAENAMAGLEGRWQQVIEGSERRVEVGQADYHEVHGHFHILDFVATDLYEFDVENGERGDPVGVGRKMGFCVIDGGIVDTLGPVVPPQFHGDGCCYIVGICQMDMIYHEHFRMGMSPNWYDIYPWWRSDQYVEVSGLPDGVYEMVSVINPDRLIEETDYDNNEASTVLRVSGDKIEVLSMSSEARLGPHPDADWGYAAQKAQDA